MSALPAAADMLPPSLAAPLLTMLPHAHFQIAPERSNELLNAAMGGNSIPIVVDDTAADHWNFEARPTTMSVRVTSASMMGLWSVCAAARLLAEASLEAHNAGKSEISTSDPRVAMAFDLRDHSKHLVRKSDVVSHLDLPVPARAYDVQAITPVLTAGSGPDDPNLRIAIHFFRALGWMILHEVAHLVLGHVYSSDEAKSKRQEQEADKWAIEWVMRDASGIERDQRMFAIGLALSWVAIIDEVKGPSKTHPRVGQRLEWAYEKYQVDPNSDRQMMLAWALKALFDPLAVNREEATPDGVLTNQLISINRQHP